MSSYVISPQAKSDLRDIRDFLGDHAGRSVAARVLSEIRSAILRIIETPVIGHTRTDLAEDDLRFYRVFRYLIIYRQRFSKIQIVRVLHSARDVKRLLEN